MLFITSPAKRLDFSSEWSSKIVSKVVFKKESEVIAKLLKKYSLNQLSKKLHISEKLAQLNHQRFQSWDVNDNEKLKPAIYAYKGDVYKALDIDSLSMKDFAYLQNSLRIITGMYGILKPYDLIQAYRLEMKIKLGESSVNSLYDYWSQHITSELNKQIKENNHKYIINLSSQEYSNAIDQSSLIKPLVNIKFTQMKNGVVKSIGIHNKRARGLMIRYAAQTAAKNIDDLAEFNLDGYKLVERFDKELVFLKS